MNLIVAFCILIFIPSLFNFFSAEDWYFLRISQIDNIDQFLNFFSFTQTPQSTPFYRPVSTQLFYFTFQELFGLQPFFYHLFTLLLFGTSLYLVYKLGNYLLENNKKSLLVVLFYGVSATHFTSLYLLAAAQDIFSLVFGLSSILYFLKGSSTKSTLISLLLFVLALLGKETAVMIPAVLFLIMVFRHNLKVSRLIPFAVILIPYLILRVLNYSPDVENSYLFDFSLFKLANTLLWYFLWSLGTPELLVDYVGSGFRIVPKFFSDYQIWSYLILGFLIPVLISYLLLILQKIRQINRTIIFGLMFFIITLLPVVFLPWHKFTYYLTYPMIGFAITSVELLNFKKGKGLLTYTFISLFILFNLLTVVLSHQTHYSITRGNLSLKVLNYFKDNYPVKPTDSYFEFINDTPDYGKEWGSSKQIAHSISFSDMFKVFYGDPGFEVFYEDIERARPQDKKKIEISTKRFLEY